MNTRKISATIAALILVVMASSSLFNDINELQPKGTVELSHGGGVSNGSAMLGGILTWQDDAWNATWNCSGGLALVTPSDWSSFVASGEHDPHNYTSWGIGISGAGSYYTANAPEGEWVVTAGLSCVDDMGDPRSAGGQFGDVHDTPPTVNLTNGTTVGDVSFTLIEHNDNDGPTFVCGNGEEIPFNWVNDGDEDCSDGSDEPQDFDSDGVVDNWFNCHDGTNISMDLVNNGNDDCPDGEDEGDDGMSLEEFMEALDADGDGYLSLQEILDFVNEEEYEETGENLSQEQEDMISGAFADADSDGDGLLDSDELVMFAALMDDMDEDGNDGPTFVCGNGEEIPFNWVNDGDEDCSDGSDEPQDFDSDGVVDNWFNCHDGTNISMDLVNNGNDDCPDGEDEGGNDGDGPDCESLMEISFLQMADDTAELTFANTCTFDAAGSADMMSWMDSDFDGNLSAFEIAVAQDGMNNQTCYDGNGTEVPCGDDDDGLFSFDGTVMVTQPEVGDNSMSIISVDSGIISMSSTEVISVPSNSSLYSHTFEYDAGADWDGGHDECMGGVSITATSPWSVSNVSFAPTSDWIPAMYADGSGWIVDNFDADEDGHCNSEPSSVVIVFTTPEPEPVVDTTPVCDIYYNVGGAVLTAGSTWSVQVQGAVSFEVPSNGEYTLALPVGEYSVILACEDAEGDAIVVSVTDGTDTWGGTAQDGVIYAEGVFNITEDNVSESVDLTLTWSSTAFGGTFNTHFTAVESLDDAIADTDTGALPGFSSMLSITAMLGAAMILAGRRN